jgi:hypothetical protein
MTHWINDLSLSGQYQSVKEFCTTLDQLLSLRERNEVIQGRILCSPELGTRPVIGNTILRDIVLHQSSHLLRQRTLRWIGKDGPFRTGERAPNDDDLFWFERKEVTDQGLGEAARRRILSLDARTFSFPGSEPSCDSSPLEVVHGLLEEPLANVEVPNTCSPELIASGVVNSLGLPRSWHAAFDSLRIQFHRIAFAPELERFVEGQPFVRYVYERSRELLAVLDRLLVSRDENGQWTSESNGLIANHFQGEKAWFSDESEGNKRDFERELTFRDPEDVSKELFCPWHGKIKTPQYRIHFQWPIGADQTRAKVVYIGPKITKG